MQFDETLGLLKYAQQHFTNLSLVKNIISNLIRQS